MVNYLWYGKLLMFSDKTGLVNKDDKTSCVTQNLRAYVFFTFCPALQRKALFR